MFTKVRETIEMLLGVIEGIIETFIGLVTGDFERMEEGVMQIWESLRDGITALIKNAIDFWREPIQAVIQSIIEIFQQIIPQMKEVGQNLLDGLIEGIKGKVGDAVDTARDAAGGVVDGAKSLFGIDSPSKVFMGYGRNLMEGLELGIEENADKPTEKIEKFANDNIEMFENMNKTIENNMANTFERLLTEGESFSDKFEIIFEGMKSVVSNVYSKMTSEIASSLMDNLQDQVKWLRQTLANVAKAVSGFIQQAYAQLLAFYAFLGPGAPVAAGATIAVGMAALGALASKAMNAVGLEEGGLVNDETFAMIGEGKDKEAVIPLNDMVFSKLGQGIAENANGAKFNNGGNNGKQTANIIVELDGRTLAKSVKQPLADEIRVKGGVRM